MKKLSKKSEQVVEAFDLAALDLGVQGERGLRGDREDAKNKYDKTKRVLIRRLWYLEQRVRHFQAKDF